MTLKFIPAFFLMLATLFSCSENFFDKRPIGVKSENIFYTEKGIDLLLIGAYALVGGGITDDFYGYGGASVTNWSFGSASSDDAYIGSDSGTATDAFDIEEWKMYPGNSLAGQKWKWYLMGVTRVNGVLRALKATEGLTPEKAVGFEAEALNAFAQGDLRIRSNMQGRVFTDKAKYAPIPRSQINLQPDVLIQNPGY